MINPDGTRVSLLSRLSAGEVLISDGATGTYLQNNGLEPGGCPEEFNLNEPDIVRQMARDYFEAGSDMVLTNSFGGNPFMLKKYGQLDRLHDLNRLAAEHARSTAPQGGFVVGSVGPTGEFLEPLGNVSERSMYDGFKLQMEALAAGGADAILIETMTALDEASLAIKAAKENTSLTVLCTMTFDKGPRGYFTMMGIEPERAAKELQTAGADVVGANCGNGIEKMIEIAKVMREAVDGYILIHSNAGIPSIQKNEIVYPEKPEYMARRFKILADIGINVVGGCCGTTPAHIKALSNIMHIPPTDI